MAQDLQYLKLAYGGSGMKHLTLLVAVFTFASFMLALPCMPAKAQERKSWKELTLNKDLSGYQPTDTLKLPNGSAMIIFQDPIYAKPNSKEITEPLWTHQDKPKNAILCLKGNHGKILDLKELERPAAKFVKNTICPGSSIYLLEVDYGVGMGSYNGPITFLLEAKNEKISFVRTEYEGQMKELTLMTSLKTGWWPTLKMANGCHDVLSLSCRPDFDKSKDATDKMEFMLIYRRYHFNGQKWMRFEKTRSGFWEYENKESIPDETLFPNAVPQK